MLRGISVLGVLLAVGVGAGLFVAADRPASIKEIMARAHKPKKGLRDQVAAEAARDNPDWVEVQRLSKELVTLAQALGRCTPPQGEPGSWAKLTEGYLQTAKALDAAAGQKDAQAVLAANRRLGASCTECHTRHRPED
jgi:cytochrome c556